MKNFKQPGNMLTVVAVGAAIPSGALVGKGGLVGVAGIAAAIGNQSEVALKGVFRIPKATALAMTQGDSVYSAFTNQIGDAVNKTASGRVFAGWVWKDALAADTFVEVLMPLGGE